MIGLFDMFYAWFRGKLLAIPGRLIALIFVVFLFILPAITQQPYLLRIIIITSIMAIFAASWDLLAFTGQVNLGHALFFGVSAYTIALLNIHLQLPPWVTIPCGSLAAVLVGLIAGIPALRLRGFYLSLLTLAFPVIVTGLVYTFPDITGGEMGLSRIDRLSNSRITDYYIVQVIFIFSVMLMWKFTDINSVVIKIGVIFHCIREDEITARASGINTTKYKLIAFGISGFFAGIAGGLYGHFLRNAGPSTFELFFSFQAILWTIFGGTKTIYGAVVGVFVLYPLLELIRFYPHGDEARFIVFPLILIFTLLFMPEGIAVWILDKIEIRCQRCKLINFRGRRVCRACNAPLRLEA